MLHTESIPPKRSYLNQNQLSGTIPDSLANLTSSLQQLWLHMNLLTGTVPSWMGSLTLLWSLCVLCCARPLHSALSLSSSSHSYLTGNQLTGTIPSSFASLTLLQLLCVPLSSPTSLRAEPSIPRPHVATSATTSYLAPFQTSLAT